MDPDIFLLRIQVTEMYLMNEEIIKQTTEVRWPESTVGDPERKLTIRMREGWTSVLDSALGLSLLEVKAQG